MGAADTQLRPRPVQDGQGPAHAARDLAGARRHHAHDPLATCSDYPRAPLLTVSPILTQVQDVLDGRIAPFGDAYLRWQATAEGSEQ